MIQTAQTSKPEFTLCCPTLPLAVYREVAAHLRQVSGVDVELLPQTTPIFDYFDSQIGGLQLTYHDSVSAEGRQRVDQILAYYGDRYGAWQVLDDAHSSV